ncbi:MAG TPA: asparagine synthase (glutamine-hydrolyzing) [Terriglobales bacterium]|nr:asparagine synthase (glutamine-hydrolyzing) [Terriglobales bacterium]
MCGIAGFVDGTGSLGMEALASASQAIAHRGPDDSGLQILSTGKLRVGLANRRLAILDLSPAGHQPMHDSETGNWIVYNGEVYNFAEIRAWLEADGISFTSHCDTEVILKAYGRWGTACPKHFRGMFAFAIWDAGQQQLFLARDRLGIKPLYYAMTDGGMVFASEVRAILASGLISRRLNQVALAQYLSFGSIYEPETIIEGIAALAPGHCLLWKASGVDDLAYWELRPPARLESTEAKQVEQEVAELLNEAVSLRCVSDVPIGVFLSGGIDSSAIVAALHRLRTPNVGTFSLVFQEQDFTEAGFSRQVARKFRTDHSEIVVSQSDVIEAIPHALRAMDQPSVDGINTFMVSREARRAGFKVALSGLGGDEVFAGYETFRSIPRMDRLRRLVPRYLGNAIGLGLKAWDSSDKVRKFHALFDAADNASSYAVARMLFIPEQQRRILKDGGNVTWERAAQPLRAAIAHVRGFDDVNRVSYLELRNYMLNTLLRDTDCMSMAHGLEVRVPLLDHKLVEFLFSLPAGQKLRPGFPKYLLVNAVRDLLPPEVVHRPKRGFTLPFEQWLRDELRDELQQQFGEWDEGPLASYIEGHAVGRVWSSFLAGRTSWSRPWALYVLNQWCATNVAASQTCAAEIAS